MNLKFQMKRLLNLGLTLICILIMSSCTEKNGGYTPIKKGGGGNNTTKPSDQILQDALNAKVLLLLDKKSELKAANKDFVNVALTLNLNAKNVFDWKPTLNLPMNSSLKEVISYPAETWPYDENLKLTLNAARVNKAGAQSLGYMGLAFSLKKEEVENDKSRRSLLLVLIDLDFAKTPKAFIKLDVIFPAPATFSLTEWIDKQIKKP